MKDTLMEKYLNEGMASLDSFDDDIQILRAVIYAETDAANLYNQMAHKASSSEVKKLLLDIAKEEDVHLYEAQNLLEKIYPHINHIKDQATKETMSKFGF